MLSQALCKNFLMVSRSLCIAKTNRFLLFGLDLFLKNSFSTFATHRNGGFSNFLLITVKLLLIAMLLLSPSKAKTR